jgi:hydroxypyruvate isomerase
MTKLAANLSFLFGEVDFLARFEAAARAGFRGVEYLFPYAYPVAQIAELLESYGLTQVVHNLPAGDWAAGERGIACQPKKKAEFREGVDRALEYASALRCKRVNCLAGIAPPGVAHEALRETMIENLAFAADKLGAAGIQLLIEPINTRDLPGFFLCRSAQAIDILDAVGSPHLGLQYDVYHMQIMEGDLAPTLARLFDRIGHVQIADNPGRHEPGTGEIHYPFLFSFLEKLGYAGWIGCEYRPETTTTAGLGWARDYLSRRAERA